MNHHNHKIAVIGLGYVGLPLAIEFGKKYDVLGFDINARRVEELKRGEDHTNEADLEGLREATALRQEVVSELALSGEAEMSRSEVPERSRRGLWFSSDKEDLKPYNTFIVTVPTPIDQFKAPDLTPLLKASEMIGSVLKKGDIVIYESTVYPGCTEEDCVPVLEQASGLKFNIDFFCGYSPERINPGDKVNTLTKIKKVTSGSTPDIAETVDQLYRSIITAGTHKAPNLKVAEASKAIENAQRDVNISFVNELALIFDRIGIDTTDVIEAAGTKWNFLKYKPGLVGGHCIGVDPYYLAHKAESLGYHPEVILSGRRLNDNMGMFVANKVVKLMIAKGHRIKGSKVLILGITFKENCPDIRNTRVTDIYHELVQYGMEVDMYDPHASPDEVKQVYRINCLSELPWSETTDRGRNGASGYDAIILAVAHKEFRTLDLPKLKNGDKAVIFDTKSFLDRNLVDGRL